MAATYDIGNKVRFTGTFTDPLNDDDATDPSSVYCSIRTPSNVTTTYQYGVDSEVNKSSTGIYYIDVALSSDGTWYVRWWGKDAAGTTSVAEEVAIKCVAHQAV